MIYAVVIILLRISLSRCKTLYVEGLADNFVL